MKSTVKFEHCEADGGKKATNDACATQMVDARMKIAVSIQLGMTGRMGVVVYMQMVSRGVRRFRALTTLVAPPASSVHTVPHTWKNARMKNYEGSGGERKEWTSKWKF